MHNLQMVHDMTVCVESHKHAHISHVDAFYNETVFLCQFNSELAILAEINSLEMS